MNPLHYSIAAEVFARFPEYRRGVVIAHDVSNGESPPPLREMLRSAEASLRKRLNLDQLASHPRIASWREAFRVLGVKPTEFRPSIEALARRVLRDQELPAINALVDIGTILSLHHVVPVGGHAIDVLTRDISLRPASGVETFVAFGSEQSEHPDPGEIIFVEGETVLTRRWIWRQANHTLTQPATTAIEINFDGMPPVTEADLDAIGREAMELVSRYCGGRTRFEILSRQNPRLSLGR